MFRERMFVFLLLLFIIFTMSLLKHSECTLDQGKERFLPKLPPRSACFKRLGRNLYRCMLISYKNKETNKIYKSYDEVLREVKRQLNSKHWYLIHPLSDFAMYWRIFMVFMWSTLLPYDIWNIAFRDCIDRHSSARWLLVVISITYNIVLMIDIGVRLFTGYIDKKTDECIMSPKRIFLRYVKSFWFWVDLYTWYFLTRMILQDLVNTMLALNALRYVRMARIITIICDLKLITDICGFSELQHMIFCVIITTILLWHFNACLLTFVPKVVLDISKINRHSWTQAMRMYYMQNGQKMNCVNLYFHSLYEMLHKFNLGLVAVLPTHSTAENFLLTLCLIGGYLLKGVFLLVLYYLFYAKYSTSNAFDNVEQQLYYYIDYMNVSKDIERKLIAYYRKRYMQNTATDHFHDLSSGLRYELCTELWKSEIVFTKLFQNLPDKFLNKLTDKFELEIFLPGHVIYRTNDKATCVYFLCSGEVAQYGDHGKEICHYNDGQHFGVTAFDLNIDDPIREETMISVEYCEVLIMQRSDLQFYSKYNPKFQARLAYYAKKKIQRHATFVIQSQLSGERLMDRMSRLSRASRSSKASNWFSRKSSPPNA